jgi:hypothetical protein
MKVILYSNKVALVRHWGRWYRVQRGATDWRRLKVKENRSIEEIAGSIAQV